MAWLPGARSGIKKGCRRNMKVLFGLVVAIIMAAGVANPVQAQGREFLGGYRDWDAFLERRSGGEKTCYMISVPKDTEPKNVRRGEIYIIVTHWPEAKIRSQVNVVVGYPFRQGGEATVTVDNRAFRLFTEGDRAWAYDDKQDADMAEAMKRGTTLVVRGSSQRGTNTTDRYSLMGFTAAHNAITQACY